MFSAIIIIIIIIIIYSWNLIMLVIGTYKYSSCLCVCVCMWPSLYCLGSYEKSIPVITVCVVLFTSCLFVVSLAMHTIGTINHTVFNCVVIGW